MGSPASGWRATGPAAGRRPTRRWTRRPETHGFDENYFVQQVAGLSQLAGEFMLVKPLVIDLGWGELKSALVKLPDAGFAAPREAAARRQALVSQYVAAFGQVEAADLDEARSALQESRRPISPPGSCVTSKLASVRWSKASSPS